MAIVIIYSKSEQAAGVSNSTCPLDFEFEVYATASSLANRVHEPGRGNTFSVSSGTQRKGELKRLDGIEKYKA